MTSEGMDSVAGAAGDHALLVRELFFEPLSEVLLRPLTAALEPIQASPNFNASLLPEPL
jgi:hypothetical protein